MTMIIVLKWLAVVSIIFLCAGIFFGAASLSGERGDAFGPKASFAIICFFFFLICLVIWLLLAAIHWWPF